MKKNKSIKNKKRKAQRISLTLDEDLVEELFEYKRQTGCPVSRQLENVYKVVMKPILKEREKKRRNKN